MGIITRKSCESSNPGARCNLETFVTGGHGLLIPDVTARTAVQSERGTERRREMERRGCTVLAHTRARTSAYSRTIFMAQATCGWKRMPRTLGCFLDNRPPARKTRFSPGFPAFLQIFFSGNSLMAEHLFPRLRGQFSLNLESVVVFGRLRIKIESFSLYERGL